MCLKQRENTIYANISNASLVYCARIAEKVKMPKYIPFYEVCTYGLLADYFDVPEKRVMNAYKSYHYIIENDSTLLTGKEITQYAIDYRNLGKSYGYMCQFANGVTAQLSYSFNQVFNSRALLYFAVILHEECETAREIYNILYSEEYKRFKYLDKRKPWFLTDGAVYKFKDIKNQPSVICPYFNNTTSANLEYKVEHKVSETFSYSSKKRVAQFDSSGNYLREWECVSDISRALGISKESIYRNCQGKTNLICSGRFKFQYIDK